MTFDSTCVGVGMSSNVEAWSSFGGSRRECVGPVQVNGGEANGVECAVSGPWGPIL